MRLRLNRPCGPSKDSRLRACCKLTSWVQVDYHCSRPNFGIKYPTEQQNMEHRESARLVHQNRLGAPFIVNILHIHQALISDSCAHFTSITRLAEQRQPLQAAVRPGVKWLSVMSSCMQLCTCMRRPLAQQPHLTGGTAINLRCAFGRHPQAGCQHLLPKLLGGHPSPHCSQLTVRAFLRCFKLFTLRYIAREGANLVEMVPAGQPWV